MTAENESGAEMIATERQRQIRDEGYTREHDANHAEQLTWAARCYAENVAMGLQGSPTVIPGAEWSGPPNFEDFPWPWAARYWKPTGDPVRDLVKAGALIAAAIDSMQQTSPRNPEVGVRCGECRMGLGTHRTEDPLCTHHIPEEARS